MYPEKCPGDMWCHGDFFFLNDRSSQIIVVKQWLKQLLKSYAVSMLGYLADFDIDDISVTTPLKWLYTTYLMKTQSFGKKRFFFFDLQMAPKLDDWSF